MATFGDADGDGVSDEDMEGASVIDGEDGTMAASMDGIVGSMDGIMGAMDDIMGAMDGIMGSMVGIMGSIDGYISMSTFMDGCG